VQNRPCENGHEHGERPTQQADRREKQQDGANRREAGNVRPALFHLHEHGVAGAFDGGGVQAHGVERGDDGEVTDPVNQEAVAFAGDGNDHTGERRADEARQVDHGRVHGDGVAEVLFVFYHLDEEGLAAGHVEGVDRALKGAEPDDFVNVDVVAEGESG